MVRWFPLAAIFSTNSCADILIFSSGTKPMPSAMAYPVWLRRRNPSPGHRPPFHEPSGELFTDLPGQLVIGLCIGGGVPIAAAISESIRASFAK